MAAVKINQKYTFAVEINEQGLRRLYDEVSKALDNGKTSFTIIYSNKSSVTDATIEEVIDDENRKGREIRELKVNATSNDRTIY